MSEPDDISSAEQELAAANNELAWELKKAAVDAAGVADPTPISDGVGAAMSLSDGDFWGAGLSLISMVPYIGDALGKTAKGARALKKLAALRSKVAGLLTKVNKIKAAKKEAKALEDAEKAAVKAQKSAPDAAPCATGKCPIAPTPASTLPIPKAVDPNLENLVQDLYKGAKTKSPIGTGSAADAVRNELATGLPTRGKFHSQKAEQYVNALTNWLRKNPTASYQDRLIAESLKRDLQSALGGN